MILGQPSERRCDWSAVPLLPFGCVPVVRYARCPVFPRLDGQTTSRSPPPLLSYPPPPPTHFQRPTWAWHHQLLNASGPKMAPQLLLWHTEKSLTDSSCWAETGQGHSQNEIHRLYLRKHQVLTWLLDQSGLGKLQ